MPRAGLDAPTVAAAAAQLADEVGFADLTMAQVAAHLGVKTPSLYKHVANQGELNRRIAALALTEAGTAIGAATQGLSGRDALRAAAHALRDFIVAHPGRYAATLELRPADDEDPLIAQATASLDPFAAVLRGYDIAPDDMTHALRTLRSAFHGFATLQASGGFQWNTDIDASFDWLVDLVDRGLRQAP